MLTETTIAHRIREAATFLVNGRLDDARRICQKVLEEDPRNLNAARIMAHIAWRAGVTDDAEAWLVRARTIAPDAPSLMSDLAALYVEKRRFLEAMPLLDRLLLLDPSAANKHMLAQCAWDVGDYERALALFEQAATQDPEFVDATISLCRAYLRLGRRNDAQLRLEALCMRKDAPAIAHLLRAMCLFDDARRDEAMESVQAALARAPEDPNVRLAEATLLALGGDETTARRRLEPFLDRPRVAARWEGFEYASRHRPPAKLLGIPEDVLAYGLAQARRDEGLFIEFGVYHGRSLNLIAAATQRPVHGFDSFRGLPEDWKPGEPKGSYSTNGRLPEVPPHVTLHAGWYEETVPVFARSAGDWASFVHIDCDLYSSTRTALDGIRPLLRPGTVLVFDDYRGYPTYQEHEFRAWKEFVRDNAIEYRYLAFSWLGREAAVEITAIS